MSYGLHILGSTVGNTLSSSFVPESPGPDTATIQRVQGVIMKLAALDPAFRALQVAVDTQINAFGVNGPATKKAVKRFNEVYGWPDDGEAITAGTLVALDRPDVKAGKMPDTEAVDAATDEIVKAQGAVVAAAEAKQTATTPAEQVAADDRAKAAKALADGAVKLAQQAGAPANVVDAAAKTVQAAFATEAAKTPEQAAAAKEQAAGATAGIAVSWYEKKWGPLPVYGWGIAGGALAAAWRIIRGKWL